MYSLIAIVAPDVFPATFRGARQRGGSLLRGLSSSLGWCLSSALARRLPGRRILDEFTWECLAIRIDRKLN